MLLEAPNRSTTTTSSFLGGPWGPIGLVGPIGAVESNGVSTGLYYSNTTGLEGLSVLSATAIDAVVALSTVDSDRSVGLVGRSECLYRPIRIPLVDEVSFKIKDTFQSFQSTCDRSRNTWS